jgi:Ca-activated chloride channel family protein
VQASIRLDHQLVALEGEHDVNVMLQLRTARPDEGTQRAPLRLALVLDRSGSMGGRKLELAKRCAAWLAGRLAPADRLAVVAYDDEVRLVSPLRPAGDPAIGAAIGGLRTGGSTNLSGGWLEGRRVLAAASGDGPRKLLLLTDGLANVGVTDPTALVELANSASREGIGTTTIGVGDDFDERLLTAMADAGGGNAHYADTPDAAPGIFAREFDGLTRLVAQNVAVEIRPAVAVELLCVLNDYPAQPVGGGVLVQLGDAYAGESRRLVLSLHVPHLAALGPAKVCDLTVRYVAVGNRIAEHTLTLPVVVNVVSAAEAAATVPDAGVVEEVLVLRAARARDDAIRLADEGDHAGAQRLLRAAAGELRACAARAEPELAEALAYEAGGLDCAYDLAAPATYGPANRKQLHYQSHQRRRGRPTA